MNKAMSLRAQLPARAIHVSGDAPSYLIESLKDPEEAAAYIETILEAADPEPQLLSSALQDVVHDGDF